MEKEKMNPVFTLSGLKIANDFVRIVRSDAGDYVEMLPKDVIMENIKVPIKQKWRINRVGVYYVEYRTIDSSDVMIYQQKRRVNYADYKIGFFYVSRLEVKKIGEGF